MKTTQSIGKLLVYCEFCGADSGVAGCDAVWVELSNVWNLTDLHAGY
jgi:hypothetical protein